MRRPTSKTHQAAPRLSLRLARWSIVAPFNDHLKSLSPDQVDTTLTTKAKILKVSYPISSNCYWSMTCLPPSVYQPKIGCRISLSNGQRPAMVPLGGCGSLGQRFGEACFSAQSAIWCWGGGREDYHNISSLPIRQLGLSDVGNWILEPYPGVWVLIEVWVVRPVFL